MKGHFAPAPPDPMNPATAFGGTYTDAADQDWVITLTMQGTYVAKAAHAENMYGVPTSKVIATANSMDNIVLAVDQWVDSWNSGANPAPVIITDVKSSKGSGAGWLVLAILAAMVLSDNKGRRR